MSRCEDFPCCGHDLCPDYIDGKQVNWGEGILGGSFRGHHGRYHADSTRGLIVEGQKNHPILRGVEDIWGNSDVYRTYKEGGSLPSGCTALVWGQPLMGRKYDDLPNPKLEALPVGSSERWKITFDARADHGSGGLGRATDDRARGARGPGPGPGAAAGCTSTVAWPSRLPLGQPLPPV